MSDAKLKILYVTCTEIDRRNGAAVNESESIRGLLACENVQVHAVAAYRENVHFAQDLSVSTLTRVKGHCGRPRGYFLYWFRMLRAIAAAMRQHQPDIILYRISLAPVPELLIHFCTRRPYAIKTWKDPSDIFERRWGGLGNLIAKISRALQGVVLRRAVVVDVQSKEWGNWLHQMHQVPRSRIRVVPNGANGERFLAPQGRREGQRRVAVRLPRFIYAGAFHSVYELDVLVDAVAAIDPAKRDFEVVIAGAGPEEADLRARIERSGVADRFSFQGWVPYSELPELLWACDWGIDLAAYPISKASAVRTSISQKSAQYLVAGLPVVAWDIDGSDFLRENSIGLLAQHRSAEDLSRVLLQAVEMFRNGDLDAMSRRGIEFASCERSQEAMASARCKMYQQMLHAA